MKLLILKDNLKNALATAERAVTESATLPILHYILFKTGQNILTLSSTNLEFGIITSTPAKILEEGSCAIPLLPFYTIISNIDADRIQIEQEKQNLIVKTDNYKAVFQTAHVEEFPAIPQIEDKNHSITIENSVFTNALLEVSSAAQISEIRPEISGILFSFEVSSLKLVATDSFRLAEKTIHNSQFKTNFIKGFHVIIPLKTIQEVMRIFSKTESITIKNDANQITFTTETTELSSRLIDGKYPDYEQYVPKSFETELFLHRERFVNAIKLASGFSGKSNEVQFSVAGGKALEVYSSATQVGENHYLLPAKVKGSSFSNIRFNWKYLIDGVKPITSEQLVFGLNGDSKPAVVKSPDDASYFYIVMPVKPT